ncbi:unnamed protein product [Rotaria sp. Silwood2]|nr:unnamed protein product [Rotaria sp. Silwood2]CAF3329036.1 unnamed protein product [Rotaria sp. Silwood2]CAF4033401.1 unnamed protein product [Rotaria sp. Silwood2]CAF4040657.1 unnamed protein product [Rotaria sp. Silwood2]CAF4150669.1 unnamed protein product [Rotaria sp. Silwood2]
MSSKQYQITSFFQNKKQKTDAITDNHADSLNIPSIDLVDHAESVNLSKEFLSTEPTEASSAITTENKTKLKCDLLCCMSDTRYIPEKQSHLKSTSDKRSCQLGWFTKYNWLSYCKSSEKVYCFYCRTAYQSKYHPQANKTADCSFTARGFDYWKNGLAKFEKHESSECHADCIYLVKQQQQQPVAAQISLTHKSQQAQRRKMLLIQVQAIKFLLRQGLALRGHAEIEGNLIQLLKLRQSDTNELSTWINIICDETTDSTGSEQMCFTIRSVDDQFIVHEDVIGLYQLNSQHAEHITQVILDILIRCDLDIKFYRGQGYDGAATMSGHLSGVSARIKNLNPKAYFVHCNAHSLDLALQDLTCESPSISKRLHFLDSATELKKYSKLKSLCPTRWTVRAASMNSLIINYDLVETSLNEIISEGGPPSIMANGYLEQLYKFSTYFGLKLGHLIFSPTEEISCSLQRIENCLQDVLCAIKTLIGYLQRIKCIEYFKTFYELMLKEAELLTEEAELPRVRKPPQRFADTLRAPVVYQNVFDMYQEQYFNVIDKVLIGLNLRFQQSVFPLLCKVEKFILAAANGTQEEANNLNIHNIAEFLTDDIDIPRLQREINMIPDYFSVINLENNFSIKKITKIQTICDLLNVQSVGKSMFCEYTTLIRLYLTVPVTTATAEHSFSTMNRQD